MKKLITILFGVLLVLGMSVPAMATVLVWGTVSLDKDITVTESSVITKVVSIYATVNDTLVEAAEADSLINQDNVDNEVSSGDEARQIDGNLRTAKIDGSIIGNTGIVGVNQDAGNMNNQANVVSIAAVINEGVTAADEPGIAHAQADATQLNILNYTRSLENYLVISRSEVINNSINSNTGIVGVNQSVGNMNNQANQVSVAAAETSLVALAEADLGQINAGNHVTDFGTVRTDTISGSINNNTGVVGVNQSSGNMNNQINTVSIAATLR